MTSNPFLPPLCMRYLAALVLLSVAGCGDPAEPVPPLPAEERLQRSFDVIEQEIRQAWRDGHPVEVFMTTFGDSIPRFTVRAFRRAPR